MIYITGDTHIPLDVAKLKTKCFPKQKELTKDDCVIICGDFGGVWDNSRTDLYWRKWLDDKHFTTLFVDGNHENYDLLERFPVVELFGAKAQKISDSVYHLLRGQIYTIEGQRFFTLGGAASHDKEWRKPGKSWWKQELPDHDKLQEIREMLASLEDKRVDYIVTHCAPTALHRQLAPTYDTDVLTDFLQEVSETIGFKAWFFGHYHQDKELGNGYYAVFNAIYELE